MADSPSGMAAVLLVEQLLNRLQKRGVISEEDRRAIIDDAIAVAEGAGAPARSTVVKMRRAFRVPAEAAPRKKQAG